MVSLEVFILFLEFFCLTPRKVDLPVAEGKRRCFEQFNRGKASFGAQNAEQINNTLGNSFQNLPSITMKPSAIVPFGKYKGQPVEVLAQDEQYLDWLKHQDWFKSQHQNIYAIIINQFQAPSDTPESNRIQARFIDDEYRRKVAYLMTSNRLKPTFDGETESQFEEGGLDVLIKSSHAEFRHEYHIYIEIKPQISDDYPAVLRQIINSSAYRKYKNKDFGKGEDKIEGMMFGLVIEDYSGSISAIELWDYFIASDVQVYFTSEIDEMELEFSEEELRFYARKRKPRETPSLEQRQRKILPDKNEGNVISKPSQLKLFDE